MTTQVPSDPREIVLDNIGPHEKLRLNAQPGKITVLVGPNGAGKTQALDAVDAVQRNGKRLASRDGTMGGSARFGGAMLKVTRGGVNRKSGELEVESLEDRLSISTFVDPGLKDRPAADEHRIRALLLLAGAESDIERFYELADEETLREIAPDAFGADDVIKQAAKIKKSFEAAARQAEKQVQNVERERDGIAAANEGIDLDVPHDESELDEAMLSARDDWTELREKRQAGKTSQDLSDQAGIRLQEAETSYTGPTVGEAKDALEQSAGAWNEARETFEKLKRDLNQAEAKVTTLRTEYSVAEDTFRFAQSHEETIAAWRETVEAGTGKYPKQESVDDCEESYLDAKKATEQGVRVRDAIGRHNEIAQLSEKVIELSERGESLRNTGRNTQVVLSRMVEELGVPLRVDEEFRLVCTNHSIRGECYFDELSMGEKWKLGIDIVLARANGRSALLSIPQEAWESLDGHNRSMIADAISGTDLSIITAEAQQYRECESCHAMHSLDEKACTECESELPPPALTASAYGED